jgi:hypothetical protein
VASIVYRQGRDKPWLARIHRKGHTPYSKAFLNEAAAKRWANEEERNLELKGLPRTAKENENTFVWMLAERYLKEVSPDKGSYETEKIIIGNFLKRPLAKKSIAYLSTQDGVACTRFR